MIYMMIKSHRHLSQSTDHSVPQVYVTALCSLIQMSAVHSTPDSKRPYICLLNGVSIVSFGKVNITSFGEHLTKAFIYLT